MSLPREHLMPIVLVSTLLLVLGVHVYTVGGLVTDDTREVMFGASAAVTCLERGDLACNGVFQYPPLQYAPAMLLKWRGTQFGPAEDALVYLNFAAICATLLTLAVAGLRLARGPGAALAVAVGLASPLLTYGAFGFGEALGVLATTLFAALILIGAPPLAIGAALAVACLSKETALPFLVAIGIAAWAVQSTPRLSARRLAYALAGGAVAGVAVVVAFNLFRFGVPWNEVYSQSVWRVPEVSRRAEFAAAGFIAPNAGMLWFWPLASALLGIGAVWSWSDYRKGERRRSLSFMVALAVLVALIVGFANWWAPFGWWAPANRFLVPWVPAIALVVIGAYGERLIESLRRRRTVSVVASAMIACLGLAQLGAFVDPERALAMFKRPHVACKTLDGSDPGRNNIYLRVQRGDMAARLAHSECVSSRAWAQKPQLIDDIAAFRGGRLMFALLFLAAGASLVVPILGKQTKQSPREQRVAAVPR